MAFYQPWSYMQTKCISSAGLPVAPLQREIVLPPNVTCSASTDGRRLYCSKIDDDANDVIPGYVNYTYYPWAQHWGSGWSYPYHIENRSGHRRQHEQHSDPQPITVKPHHDH